ncbi:preprotein translocase subunit YajC [Salicibibacter cibarius]|uniref:Preprotein translocase subunit YajC n=3 Tax=Salicibibacter TaxID=2685905 RepID=A0A514LND1_9BACI|nr:MULTISPECIES: preprotein translocase subunit YajC [Salicibibacter]QDI92821.1 preprotein translocase subunit YajC [Salicibibacter halophilus]QQK75654.1 preprotein translocase subunit YajC [Salicibibacter cibarius]QQK79554.1 preprotein translocase subunit YajC [Salicibibacter cibi]
MEAIIMLVLMFAIVYFLLIRPQQKRQKQIREMHSNLQKGDDVITIGGLHGKIDAIDEDKLVLLVDENRKLTYDRSAVREVVNQN